MSVEQENRLGVLVALLRPERATRIADVGANPINVNPYQALVDAGHAEVWGFEPALDAFAQLEKRQSEREHYLPYAIGSGETATLHSCVGGGFSSLLTPDGKTIEFLGRWRRMMRVVDRIEVATVRLDDVEDLPRVDLLKIDIQGGERDAFRHGQDKLSEAVAIITETAFIPLYEDQPLLDDQMTELRGMGFQLHKFLHMTARPLLGDLSSNLIRRMHRNQLIDGDAIFLRDLREPDAMSYEQLKHLAILADSVFASFDVALRCLEILAARGSVDQAEVSRYAAKVPGSQVSAELSSEGAVA